LSWFSKKPCAACQAKDSHIESLRAEVESLRRLVVPPTSAELLTPDKRESDLILSPDENHVALREAQYEAASIMSGNHEHFQIEVS